MKMTFLVKLCKNFQVIYTLITYQKGYHPDSLPIKEVERIILYGEFIFLDFSICVHIEYL